MTTKEILLGAADILETKGWCQGESARDAIGRATAVSQGAAFCALGAIERSALDLGLWGAMRYSDITKAVDYLEEWLLRSGVAPSEKPIVAWNDASGRTKEEVIKALREAADASE